MVPFDRRNAGKKLPGKHGQQELSAALFAAVKHPTD
jgi:hypothetical protein